MNWMPGRISRSGIGVRATNGAFALLLGLGPMIAFTEGVQAQIYTVLYNFTNEGDGRLPYGRLTQDAVGNLYGTAKYGGPEDFGLVFKLDTSGKQSAFWTSSGGDAGLYPFGGLVFADSFFYGTTSLGGCGVLFKLDATGRITVLHSFSSSVQKTDGCVPQADLVRDATGNVYGTTASGGSFGFGTVFKLDGAGNYSVLHAFAGPPGDGKGPSPGSLAFDEAGDLFGTTASGGAYNNGTIFRLEPRGRETILHHFTGGAEGRTPRGSLVRTSAGLLFGTVPYGGSDQSCSGGCGIIFGLDGTGKGAILHNFNFAKDGALPAGGLVRDAAGSLYGTTAEGGPLGYGVVFKLESTGREVILHSFDFADGSVPFATLLLDPAGTLYGTTLHGGAFGWGVVFKITQ